MTVSYKKLWHMLIDRRMRKKDLIEAAGLTAHTMLKLRNNMHVNTTIIYKICMALDCSPTEFINFIDTEGLCLCKKSFLLLTRISDMRM